MERSRMLALLGESEQTTHKLDERSTVELPDAEMEGAAVEDYSPAELKAAAQKIAMVFPDKNPEDVAKIMKMLATKPSLLKQADRIMGRAGKALKAAKALQKDLSHKRK